MNLDDLLDAARPATPTSDATDDAALARLAGEARAAATGTPTAVPEPGAGGRIRGRAAAIAATTAGLSLVGAAAAALTGWWNEWVPEVADAQLAWSYTLPSGMACEGRYALNTAVDADIRRAVAEDLAGVDVMAQVDVDGVLAYMRKHELRALTSGKFDVPDDLTYYQEPGNPNYLFSSEDEEYSHAVEIAVGRYYSAALRRAFDEAGTSISGTSWAGQSLCPGAEWLQP